MDGQQFSFNSLPLPAPLSLLMSYNEESVSQQCNVGEFITRCRMPCCSRRTSACSRPRKTCLGVENYNPTKNLIAKMRSCIRHSNLNREKDGSLACAMNRRGMALHRKDGFIPAALFAICISKYVARNTLVTSSIRSQNSLTEAMGVTCDCPTDLTGSNFFRSRPERNTRSYQRQNHDLEEQSWATRSGAAAVRCWGAATVPSDTQKGFPA